MNNLLSQKWCLCLNVQNRIKLCRAKNHKFGDETTVCSVFVLTFGVMPSQQPFLHSTFELAGGSFPDGTCL